MRFVYGFLVLVAVLRVLLLFLRPKTSRRFPDAGRRRLANWVDRLGDLLFLVTAYYVVRFGDDATWKQAVLWFALLLASLFIVASAHNVARRYGRVPASAARPRLHPQAPRAEGGRRGADPGQRPEGAPGAARRPARPAQPGRGQQPGDRPSAQPSVGGGGRPRPRGPQPAPRPGGGQPPGARPRGGPPPGPRPQPNGGPRPGQRPGTGGAPRPGSRPRPRP